MARRVASAVVFCCSLLVAMQMLGVVGQLDTTSDVPVVTEFDDPSVGVLDGWLATQEVPTPLTDALLADDAPTEEAARQQAVQLAQALEQSLNDTVGNVFIKWSKRFKHKYTSKGESNKALRKLAKALDQMAKHNADATSSSIEALNQFSDMEYDDFKAAMLVTIPPRSSKSKPGKGKGRKALQQALGVSDSAGGTERRELVASSINWAYRGITPPVMDQGLKCGSCWAMSSAAAIAAALALAYPGSAPQTFSAQYLVDCCNSQYGTADMGSQACVTGFADDVMAMAALYTVPLGGYYSAYTSGGTGRAGTCDTSKLHMTGARKWVMLNGSGKYGPQDPAGNVYGYDSVKYVTAYDENALIEAVAIQPVVFLFAVAAGFKAYGGGVYADSARECASVDLNHFMLLVGYDTGSKFWVVQNSWSASWGERGFARIKMDGTPNGVCQMYTQAYAPKLNNFRAVPDTVA